ncbi:hypothetical protein [Anaerotignum propionicum]|jgi:hypothetical protein|uniref:hypothetical protein n=1 Tax=Anaerotignum propionicum TaxID=28446 RepID=UPI00289D221A|nr:hypothetical protein [Anaerotignum propionicum]
MDFAGPHKVFSITENEDASGKAFMVHTISRTTQLVSARNGLKIHLLPLVSIYYLSGMKI